MSDELLDLEEAAKFLHMSKSALRSKPEIRRAKLAKRLVFFKQDLLVYARSRMIEQVQLTTELLSESRKCQSAKGAKMASGKSNFLAVDKEYESLLEL